MAIARDEILVDEDQLNVLSPAEYVAVLRRRWWLFLLAPVLLGGVVYWLASQQDPTYTASAQLWVTLASSSGITTSSDIQAANLLTQTYSQLVTLPDVMARATAKLESEQIPLDAPWTITGSADFQTAMIWVRATSPDPTLAAAVANATAEAFVEWIEEHEAETTTESSRVLNEAIAQAQNAIDQTSAELAALQASAGTRTPEEESQIDSLTALLSQQRLTYTSLLELQQRLEIQKLASGSGVSIVAPAQEPGQPSGRSPAIYAGLAAFFGLGIAGLGAVALEIVNRPLRNLRDIQRSSTLPVLVSIPRSRLWERRKTLATMTAPRSADATAYRALQTQLQLSANERPLGVLVVTSADPTEWTATIAANLAIVTAQHGRRVVLVECDLQRSPLDRVFGRMPVEHSLGFLLAKPTMPVEQALITGPLPMLRLLLAGPDAVANAGLVTDTFFRRTVDGLRKVADVVVLHAPPVLTASEALLVAAAADHCVVVIEAGRTRPNDLRDAVDGLNLAGVRILGGVLTHSNEKRFSS